MLIGVPKEIKNHEYRIGLTPSGVRELVANGHQVMMQRDGGASVDMSNEQYQAAGAEIVATAKEIFARPDDLKAINNKGVLLLIIAQK